MRIGILSDSHGRTDITARAVAALEADGAEMLIYLGDVETESVIDELVGHSVRLVFGNCDWDLKGLTLYARNMDVTIDHPMGQLEIDEKRIVFTHGHLDHCMNQALAENVDYLLHGHTHELRDERVGATRIINPGALHRAARYTAVILDPKTDDLTLIEIPKMEPQA